MRMGVAPAGAIIWPISTGPVFCATVVMTPAWLMMIGCWVAVVMALFIAWGWATGGGRLTWLRDVVTCGELLPILPDGLGNSCGCLPLLGVMGTGCDVTGCIFAACEPAVRPCIDTLGWICI